MSLVRTRPGAPAGPLLFSLILSLALHLGTLAWLRPRSAWQPVPPEFELRVRLARPEPAVVVPPAPPARRPDARAAARPGPLPAAASAAPAEAPESQPLRMRVVANPADYGLARDEPGRAYAWPGTLVELPFPPDGVPLRYPEPLLRERVQGLVVVRLDIARSGALERAEIVCGSPAFDAAVLEALRATAFHAPLAADGPVPAWALLEFAFLAMPPAAGDADPGRVERALAGLQRGCLRRGG